MTGGIIAVAYTTKTYGCVHRNINKSSPVPGN